MHGDRDRPFALAQRRLERMQQRHVAVQVLELPFAIERDAQALQVAGRVVHVRLGDLDVVQADDGIERDLALIGRLADHLAMHLAAGWHINDEIAEDHRLA